MSKYSQIVVYYISNSPMCVQELKIYHKSITGLVEVIFHSDSMTVIDLQSRRKGNGSALVVHAAKEAIKRGIDRIDLDDCTDLYNRDDNIYLKMGMKYVSAGDGPEMVGSAVTVAAYPLNTKTVIRDICL